MFDQIMGKATDQPDGQHFGHERPTQSGAVGDFGAVRDAEFAVAVNGRRPHQIADIADHRLIRLLAGTQRLNDMGKQAHGFIRTRQNQITFFKARGLLLGGGAADAGNFILGRHTIIQNVRRVPGCCDYTVCPLIGRQIRRHCNQRIGIPAQINRIHRMAEPVCINVPHGAGDARTFIAQLTHQGA